MKIFYNLPIWVRFIEIISCWAFQMKVVPISLILFLFTWTTRHEILLFLMLRKENCQEFPSISMKQMRTTSKRRVLMVKRKGRQDLHENVLNSPFFVVVAHPSLTKEQVWWKGQFISYTQKFLRYSKKFTEKNESFDKLNFEEILSSFVKLKHTFWMKLDFIMWWNCGRHLRALY